MKDLLERLGTSLGGRYTVEGEAGRGGMSTVFEARDLKHDRPVALKVLSPDLTAGLAVERFLREIRIAANLQHPHIVPLYDSGEADGLLYYVMPFIRGESLQARLGAEGRLPIQEALRIACEVAEALDYAHRSDVVHRDIKPGNVLLADGHALVTDFGVAAAVRTAGSAKLTHTGITVGTPSYMSPEQVDSAEVDGRSDLYSLGCVLYEMLAGHPPYDGSTTLAILARRATGDPTPLRQLRPEVPLGVERAVQRALATEANARFATAAGLAHALREAPSGAFQAAVEQVGPSIAVLPFTNMSANPDNEYFSDGITEEIINALAKLPGVKVAARTSSFAFKGENIDLRRVGETLGVRTVLEGSVRQAGDQLRVTAQLIDVDDGYHLWSERYDKRMTDVFEIQDELTAAIVEQLHVRLTSGQRAASLVRHGTDDLEAYHLYLKGRYCWERRALPQAVEYFEEAVARDPGYALANAGLADGYCFLGYYGLVPVAFARAQGLEAARRAVTAAEDLAEPYVASGLLEAFYVAYDVDAAEASFNRAISLDPRSSYARSVLAYVLGTMGRLEEAKEHGEQAVQLDPLSEHTARLVAGGYVLGGDPDAGIALSRRALELDPASGPAYATLGLGYTELGMHDLAIDALRRAAGAMEGLPLATMWLGHAYARAGRIGEARRLVAGLHERSQEAYCAWVHWSLHEEEKAFAALEAAFRERHPVAAFLAHSTIFAELRADPRYAATVMSTGLSHLAPV